MSDGARRTVVVADDEAEIRAILVEYLSGRGWQVLEATNGLEALLHVKRHAPQAVLLDLRMPRLGGLDTIKRIHRFDSTITIVVLSGHVEDEVRSQALALGAVAVLDKPADLPQVLAALDRAASRTAQSPAPPKDAPPALPGPTGAEPAPAPRAVLVVDDDPDLQGTLEEFLVAKGYQVRSASDGAAAVRQLVEAPTDAILLDIDMPGLSGIEALPTLRAIAPRAAIIMVSGTTSTETAKRSLAGGAFDYVIKPVNLTYLLETLETAFAMRDTSL